jgi:iron complex transport system ATP-binding protein
VEDIVPEVDRLIMLRHGRVLRDGPKAELMTTQSVRTLFGVPVKVEERDGAYRLW